MQENRVDANGMRTVRVDVTSRNQGYELTLAFPRGGAPNRVTVNGKLAADYTKKPYWRPFNLRGPGAETYSFEMRGPAETFKQIVFADSINLRAEQLQGMAELRPKNSDQLHSGDRAHIMTRIDLP